MHSLLNLATMVAMQDQAPQGAVQKLADPTYYDFMFPLLAFCLVIVLPSSVALWVMFRTITEKKAEADET